jgi:hypothetical protein
MRKLGISALGLSLSLVIGCDGAFDPQSTVAATASTAASAGEATPDQIPKPPGFDSSFTVTTDVCTMLTPEIVQRQLNIGRALQKDVSGNVCTFGAADGITNVTVQWGWTIGRYNEYSSSLLASGDGVRVPHVGDAAVYVRATTEPNPGNQIVFKSGTGAAIIMVDVAGTAPEPESNLIGFAKFILAPYQR